MTLIAELRESREQLAAVNEVLSAVLAAPRETPRWSSPRSSRGPGDCAAPTPRSSASSTTHRVFQLIKAVGISDESIAYIAEHPCRWTAPP